MDIFELIKADHRKVESLFSEIEKTDDSQKLGQDFKQLYQELNVHTQTEELTFYPMMRDHERTRKLVVGAEKEHNQVKIILEQMKSLDSASPEFKAKISQLKEVVEHHVQEEENKVFPQVHQNMNDQKLQQLAQAFQETRTRLQEELSFATY